MSRTLSSSSIDMENRDIETEILMMVYSMYREKRKKVKLDGILQESAIKNLSF